MLSVAAVSALAVCLLAPPLLLIALAAVAELVMSARAAEAEKKAGGEESATHSVKGKSERQAAPAAAEAESKAGATEGKQEGGGGAAGPEGRSAAGGEAAGGGAGGDQGSSGAPAGEKYKVTAQQSPVLSSAASASLCLTPPCPASAGCLLLQARHTGVAPHAGHEAKAEREEEAEEVPQRAVEEGAYETADAYYAALCRRKADNFAVGGKPEEKPIWVAHVQDKVVDVLKVSAIATAADAPPRLSFLCSAAAALSAADVRAWCSATSCPCLCCCRTGSGTASST